MVGSIKRWLTQPVIGGTDIICQEPRHLPQHSIRGIIFISHQGACLRDGFGTDRRGFLQDFLQSLCALKGHVCICGLNVLLAHDRLAGSKIDAEARIKIYFHIV